MPRSTEGGKSEVTLSVSDGLLHSQASKSTDKGPSKFVTIRWQSFLCIVSLGLLATVIVFVQSSKTGVRDSEEKSRLSGISKADASTTLSVVRTAQGVLSAIMTMLLSDAFELLAGFCMIGPDGLPFLNMLALSSGTGSMGLCRLFCSNEVTVSTRLWVLLRGGLTLAIWLSGIVLFYDTSDTTLYDTIYTYDVTAGVGPFNASLVQPYIDYLQGLSPTYPYTVLPYTQYAAAYTLVLNPLIATVSEPVSCASLTPGDCASYLFSGGLEMVAPWIPERDPDVPMIKIDNAPVVQMDFAGSLEVDTRVFNDSDCDVYGDSQTIIGIKLCVEQRQGSLRAGLMLCNGTTGDVCGSFDLQYNITSRVSFFTRQATITTARSNYSILSIADVAAPEPIIDVDLPAYRAALGWLLNYTAADIPGPSSIAQSFWSSNLQMRDPATYGILVQNFQSVLAFPFWLFNDNNWGNTALKANQTVAGLPPQFYTQASIVERYKAIDFNQAMFALFVVFQGLAILFVCGVLLWVWFGSTAQQPETSGFALFEAKYRNDVIWTSSPVDAKDPETIQVSRMIETMRDAVVFTTRPST